MERPITGFDRDGLGHWVASLSCGHGQHVRHQPPLVERTWVQSAEGRASRIGAPLDCVRCDRAELPENARPYRRTPVFGSDSVPQALLRDHATKAGVWGQLHVLEGRVDYTVLGASPREQAIQAGAPGVIVPEVPHRVALGEGATFYLEFWRVADA